MFQQYNSPNFSLFYSMYSSIQDFIHRIIKFDAPQIDIDAFIIEINQDDWIGPYDDARPCYHILHSYDGYNGYEN